MNVGQQQQYNNLLTNHQLKEIEQIVLENITQHTKQTIENYMSNYYNKLYSDKLGLTAQSLNNQVNQSCFITTIIYEFYQLINKNEQQKLLKYQQYTQQVNKIKENFINQKQMLLKQHSDQKKQLNKIIITLQRQIMNLNYQINNISINKNKQLLQMEKQLKQSQLKINQLKQQIQNMQYQKIQNQNIIYKIKNDQIMINSFLQSQFVSLSEYFNILQTNQLIYFEITNNEDYLQKSLKFRQIYRKQCKVIQIMSNLKEQINKKLQIQQSNKDINQEQINKNQSIHKSQYNCELSTQIKNYQSVAESQIKKLIKKIKNNQQTINKLKKEVQSIKSQKQILEKQSNFQKNQINKLKLLSQQFKLQIAKLNQQNSFIKTEKQCLKQKTMQYLQQLLKIKQKIQNKKGQKQQIQHKYKNILLQLSQTKENLNGVSRELDQSKFQVKSLKEVLDTFSNIKSTQNHQKQIIEQMIQKSYGVRQENKQLKDKVFQLSKKIQQSQIFSAQLKKTLQDYKVNNQNLYSNTLKLEEDLTHFKEQNQFFNLQLGQTTKSLEDALKRQQIYLQKLQQLAQQNQNHQQDNRTPCLSQKNGNTPSQFIEQQISINKTINLREQQNNSFKSNKDSSCIDKTLRLKANDKQKYVRNIRRLNEIINYMVNYAKGYTRNGIRSHCWIVSEGSKYMKKALSPENIRSKYQNFQKIRQLCEQQPQCKQLVKNYQHIMDYYFSSQ